jgi:hypothetical protein
MKIEERSCAVFLYRVERAVNNVNFVHTLVTYRNCPIYEIVFDVKADRDLRGTPAGHCVPETSEYTRVSSAYVPSWLFVKCNSCCATIADGPG